jgi:hypothetical protein
MTDRQSAFDDGLFKMRLRPTFERVAPQRGKKANEPKRTRLRRRRGRRVG